MANWKSRVSYTLVVLLAYYLYFEIWMEEEDAPIVQTQYGDVQGSIQYSRDGRPYFSYLSIPYAAKPINELRFQSPQPATPWQGVKSVKKFGPLCTQMEIMATGRIEGDEDCLHVSVVTPKIDPNNPLPVIVYIFGGLFMAGSVNFYKGTYFMDEDVVLVTVNYRVGALGFLNTGDDAIRGNMGLKDQVFALQWVQKNIRNFGGNANEVVLMGESAGGCSVHYHMLHSKSKGLFKKAISQSGTSLLKWCLNLVPEQQAEEFGTHFNCPTKNSHDMAACLRKIPATDLVRYHRGIMHPLRGMTQAFLPSIERHSDEDDKFLPAHPLELIKNGSGVSGQIPWLVGMTSDEGLYLAARLLLNKTVSAEIDQKWQEWAPLLFSYGLKGNEEASQRIRERYFGNESWTTLEPFELMQKYSRLFTEYWFVVEFDRAVRLHLSRAPVYLYLFSYKSFKSLLPLFQIAGPDDYIPAELKMTYELIKDILRYYLFGEIRPIPGACHADDVPIQFNFHPLLYIGSNSPNYQFSREIVKTWVAFASGRTPLEFNGIQWPEMKPAGTGASSMPLTYLNLTSPGGIIDDPFKEIIQFWSTIKLNYDWPTDGSVQKSHRV